jgi:hypothetical protein
MRNESLKERLSVALEVHGMSRASFASALGRNGHQKLANWLQRGRIGRPSYVAVRAILPRVSLDWLNHGVGQPPSASAVCEAPAEIDLDKLATAIEWTRAMPRLAQRALTPEEEAAFALDVYRLLAVPGASVVDVYRFVRQRADEWAVRAA